MMIARAFALAACALGLWAADPAQAAPPAAAVRSIGSSAEIPVPAGVLRLEAWSDNIIHVRLMRRPDEPAAYNPAVISRPGDVTWRVQDEGNVVTLSTATLRARVEKTSGRIEFQDAHGKRILGSAAPLASPDPKAAGGAGQSFEIDGTEAIYGLGQHQAGQFDYRGASVLLQQANSDVAIPMLVSSAGYGVLWNNPAVTRIEVATPQHPNEVRIRSDAGGVDYHVIYGPDLDAVVAGYRSLTGQAPMMARWTWGLWQSKERYQTQSETLSIVDRYRAAGIPLDTIVQDWQYWPPGAWGSHQFDPARFPDPAGLVESVHDRHAHIVISVWPRFDLTTANHDELKGAGALFEPVFSNVYPAGQGRWYDAWSAKGRAIYWDQIMRHLGRLGFDGWWLDGSEAELGGQPGQMAVLDTAAGPGAEVYNSYPLLHTTAVHDGMRRSIPGKRVVILTRSAYAGQQRNAAITWSGDIAGTWDSLARQIPAALNFSLSGVPYWSADVGGFFGGDPSDKAYAELFTRWYQFAVFNPMFRVHGTGAGKEPWAFDPATEQRLIAYAKLRYRLLPYIYATSWRVTSRADTMMRPLVMDFQDDVAARRIRDQYMFGRSLMVSPVVQPSTQARTVYLPKGVWYDFWTGERLEGARVVVAKADLDTIPVHVPAGTVLPLGPVLQYADEPSVQPLELRVFPGKDGAFELYDDAGDGYGYRDGRYATVALAWDDARRELQVGARRGDFPGMRKTVSLRITCAVTAEAASVTYDGRSVVVPMPACR
jgi:alpha-D-xyloside xylohydrolase